MQDSRLRSLDVFRGATIIAMILVNNPGTWSHVYPPLLHAEWHGWTPTDLVFPFFLFIVGVAIPLSLRSRLQDGAKGLMPKIARRAAILFALGLLLAIYPLFHFPLIADRPGIGIRPAAWDWLRIMGVLQRIGLCYLVAATCYAALSERAQRLTAAGLLLAYWAAMKLVPVPGHGAGNLDVPEATLSAYVDRAILGANHLWAGAGRLWDPEGLLSTLPAIATTLFGLFAGQLLCRESSRERVALGFFVRGSGLVVLGYCWNWVFPINKSLWTSSYAVFTAGLAFCALALCVWLFELRGSSVTDRIARPFEIYGVNALTVFVGSGLLAKSLILVKVPFAVTTEAAAAVERTSLHSWLYRSLFEPLAAPRNASLLFALTWIFCWYLVLRAMHRRGWILKV